MKISAAGTLQFPMVRHAAEIGWRPVSPAEALRLRGGEDGGLFRGELESAIRRFNPWMTEAAAVAVVERLEALHATIEGNRELLAWLRGERQWYDEAEERSRRVQLVDFDNPGNNALQVTWEWKIKPPARKGNRADVMFLVNGVPVAIVEHKNPKDRYAIEKGITQIRRYEQETPELLAAAQLFNVTHLLDYWYGVTWNISRRFMARWKERPEDTYRFAVQSFFEPTDFLRTLRDWILFYVEDGETRKTVLRQHQRRAVDRIVARCAETKKQRGLIWHTQGSGKTFTLLTAARLILEQKARFETPTVVVVVDRLELEGQLKGWVERLLGEMQQQAIPVWEAGTKEQLREFLRVDRRGLILSMIHKFEGIERDANGRDNIFVFIDEAHRSVAGDLGTYLMAAVPSATIIGFTGTPIAKTEEGKGTFKIFGKEDEQGYLDKYTIAESVEDETTLPIRHTLAASRLTVPFERLDREFFELAKDEAVTDVNELNRVLNQAVNLRTFLTADDRVAEVADFVAEHFRKNVNPLGYKAFVVGVNREACAKYKKALDGRLPPEWTKAVYSPGADDVVTAPEVAKLQITPEQEADACLMFRKADENPRILIVTDKLLTGFDAPLLYCLYLDKPMRDHVLLQAIARVNRPYVDGAGRRKRIGLIVDFVGVLREMEKALRFDSRDVNGVIEDMDLLRRDLFDGLRKATADYFVEDDGGTADERLERLIYGRFRDTEARGRFFESFHEIEARWEILSPSPELRDHLDTYRRLTGLYMAVRNAYASQSGYSVELARKTKELVQTSGVQESLAPYQRTVTFDVETLAELRREETSDEGKVFNLVRGLRNETVEKPDLEPVLLPLKERAEHIQQDLEDRKITSLAALDQLEVLAREKAQAMTALRQSGLPPRVFSIYWTLRSDEALEGAGLDPLELVRKAEELVRRFPAAASNAEEQRRLRASLYGPVIGLASSERQRIVERVMDLLLRSDPDDAS